MLNFNDGVSVDTSGELRVIRLKDGWYVTGQGMLVAVDSYQDGVEYIDQLKEYQSIHG